MHLVSHFVLADGQHALLVDHLNAQRWLPPGGHIEPSEHPRATVVRELREELGLVQLMTSMLRSLLRAQALSGSPPVISTYPCGTLYAATVIRRSRLIELSSMTFAGCH
jgi:8-oxo-dGTP pyrophosphatase MutT (NUDIX family)